MLTELTRKNGSSRVVCYQYETHLRQAGIDVHFFPPSSEALYELFCERVQDPRWLVVLLKSVYWYLLVFPRRLWQIAKSPAFDMIFLQRGLLNYDALPILETLLWAVAKKLFRRPMIYALDDAQYVVAPAWYFQLRFKLADWVYTGNLEIAEHARRFNPRVMVMESVVDTDYYRPKTHIEHWPVVIGWVGTLLDHCGPLKIVEQAIARLSQKYPVVLEVVSNRSCQFGTSQIRLVNRRWCLEQEVENLARFDIGIMPLKNDGFGRAKESYKLKQYLAMGLPVVCSPVGKNNEVVREGVTGFFATHEDEWVDKLSRLVKSSVLRAQMGDAGRTDVHERYSLWKAGPRLAAWLWQVYREQNASKHRSPLLRLPKNPKLQKFR
jgi:glycosyltransferase involved in cell wall biosynthesis